jgi:uncharacterized membrane protein YeaQ/YmgE (transglycosylase-associated protein family)
VTPYRPKASAAILLRVTGDFSPNWLFLLGSGVETSENKADQSKGEQGMSILWTILVGFIAGVLAKLFTSGPNEPSGFIMTTILGIVGAFVATFLGQALGWYSAGEGAGLIGATVGAVIVLLIWGAVAARQGRVP